MAAVRAHRIFPPIKSIRDLDSRAAGGVLEAVTVLIVDSSSSWTKNHSVFNGLAKKEQNHGKEGSLQVIG